MKPARFRILIKRNEKFFHVSDISINVRGGDIFYFQSGENIVGAGDLVPSGRTVDHLSFHKDGHSHAKDVRDKKYPAHKFLPIQDTGYQIFVIEDIGNVEELPLVSDKAISDCVLEMTAAQGVGVIVKISVISGRLIAMGQAISKKVGDDSRLIGVAHRAVGAESRNEDKMLQIALYLGQSTPPHTNIRRITIPSPTNVKRPAA